MTTEQAGEIAIGIGSKPDATIAQLAAEPGGKEWLRRIQGFQALTPAVRAAIKAYLGSNDTPFPGNGAA